jgi:hypothetical protein
MAIIDVRSEIVPTEPHHYSLDTGVEPTSLEPCTWVNERGEPRSAYLALYGDMVLVGAIARDLSEHGYAIAITAYEQISEILSQRKRDAIVQEYGQAAIRFAEEYGQSSV